MKLRVAAPESIWGEVLADATLVSIPSAHS